MDFLLTPPVAFLIYIPLVVIISLIGKGMAGPEQESAVKSSVYGSGEASPTSEAAPGYKPFFVIAFFFAFLHLGMLVLGSGNLAFSGPIAIYVIGLALALIALILG